MSQKEEHFVQQPQNAGGRIAWVDALKGIGIYLIYLIHLPGMSGNFNLFFMIIAVPLFFFAGGLTAGSGHSWPFGQFVLLKAQRILWPYFLFGGLSIAVKLVSVENAVLGDVIGWGKQLVWGMRNHLFAPALWFLPCYFLLNVFYEFLYRYLPGKKPVFIAVCCVISGTTRLLVDEPLLPWGADYALRYLFYYMAGELLAEPLEKLRCGKAKRGVFLAVGVTVLLSAAYCLVNYLYGRGYLPGLFHITLAYPGQVAELFAMALTGIVCLTALAMALANLPVLQAIGQCTLVLCCTETITKTLVPALFEAIGLTMHYETPLLGLCSAAIFLAAAYFAIARPVASYLPWAIGRFEDRNRV